MDKYDKQAVLETLKKRRQLPPTPNILLPVYNRTLSEKTSNTKKGDVEIPKFSINLTMPPQHATTSTRYSEPVYTNPPMKTSNSNQSSELKGNAVLPLVIPNLSKTILNTNKLNSSTTLIPDLKDGNTLNITSQNGQINSSKIENGVTPPFMSSKAGSYDKLEARRRTVKRYLPSIEAAMQSGIENIRKHEAKQHTSFESKSLDLDIINSVGKVALKTNSSNTDISNTLAQSKLTNSSKSIVPSYSNDKICIKRGQHKINQVQKTKSESDVSHRQSVPDVQNAESLEQQINMTLAKKRGLLRRSKTFKECDKALSFPMPPLYLRSDEKLCNKDQIPIYHFSSNNLYPIQNSTHSAQLIDSLAKLKIIKKDYIRKSFRREKLYQRRRSSLNDLDDDVLDLTNYHPFLSHVSPDNLGELESSPSKSKRIGALIHEIKSLRGKHSRHICKSFSDSNESLQSIMNGNKALGSQFNSRLISSLKSKIKSQTIMEDNGKDVHTGTIDSMTLPQKELSLELLPSNKFSNGKGVLNPRMLSDEETTLSPTTTLSSKVGEHSPSHRQTDLGEIKFSVWYIPTMRELRVEIIRAENLVKPSSMFNIIKTFRSQTSYCETEDIPTSTKTPNRSSSSKGKNTGVSRPNPFLEVSFMHEKGKITQESLDIKRHLNQSNPDFHELFIFNMVDEDILETSQLQIKVLHKSLSPLKRNELLGEVRLDLNVKDFVIEKRMWKELLPKIKKEVNGYLKIALRIDFKSKKMTVTVIQAKELPKNLLTGPPDSFVTICLVENGVPSSQNKRTKEKRKTTEPVYKEAFSLYFNAEDYQQPAYPESLSKYQNQNNRGEDYGQLTSTSGIQGNLEQQALKRPVSKAVKRKFQLAKTGIWFTVYNSNLLTKHMIGQVRLGHGSTEESEISQWREVIENPGVDITKWHYLMEA